MAKKPQYTIKEIEGLINGFYDGQFSARRLPLDLYEATVERLMDGVARGFGDYPKDDIVLTELFGNFTHNVGAFSAAKTFQQSLDLEKALFKDGMKRPFGEYKADAEGIVDTYNKNWLKTEYRTAYNNSIAARQWLDFEENKDIAPLLRYDTAHDERVRAEHVALDGIVLPVEHPFWKTNFPPNDWNCRCDATSYALDEIEQTPPEKLKGLPDPPKIFALNPAIDKVIFSEVHPYFLVADRYELQKANNFGLPVPPKPAPIKPAPGKIVQRVPFEKRLTLVKEKLFTAADLHESEIKSIQEEIDIAYMKLDQATPSGHPDRKKAVSEFQEKMIARRERARLSKIKYEDKVVDILAQDEPLAIKLKPVANAEAAKNDAINRGMLAFKRITGQKHLTLDPPHVAFRNVEGRSFFRDVPARPRVGHLGEIVIKRDAEMECVVHELFHWLEISNLNIASEQRKFFTRRTYGMQKRRLRDITKNKEYKVSEMAIEDHFVNPYSGKVYDGGEHYETLTMWATHMLGSSAGMRNFVTKDADHFEFFLKLLYESK